MSDEIEKPERQWPVTVTLTHPVEFGETKIASLEFRRGRMGDLKGIKLGSEVPANDLVLVASRLCGQPTKVIEMLDIDDAGEVMNIALDFFVKALAATGRKL